jgi:ribosomal protein S18 acetylase RimI-like enzyme
MDISKANLADAETILAIQKAAYLSEAKRYNNFEIPPLRQTLAELRQEFSTHVILKATVESTIVGSVRAIDREGTCHIGRLVVQPELQGKGIGSALLKEIENYFRNSSRFELFTGHSSAENLHLYERHGYIPFKSESLCDSVSLVFMEKPNI